MNDSEIDTIIDEIEELWPGLCYDYQFAKTGKARTPKKQVVWAMRRRLATLDYEVAHQALQRLFTSWTKDRSPRPGQIFEVLANAMRTKPGWQARHEPVLLYEVVRIGQEHGRRFYSNSGLRTDIEALERESEYVRQRMDETCGSGYYVVRHWVQAPPDAEPPIPKSDPADWGPIRQWLESRIAAREQGAAMPQVAELIEKLPF